MGAFFLRMVARPDGEDARAALTRYGLQFGLPTPGQKEALFHAAKEILAVSQWPGYYARLGLPAPRGCQEQALLLRQAMEDSSMCGYHTPTARAWAPASRRAAAGQAPRGRNPRQSERVGVQTDLQRAFRNAAQVAQSTKTGTAKPTIA